jgi:hypothetical protein
MPLWILILGHFSNRSTCKTNTAECKGNRLTLGISCCVHKLLIHANATVARIEPVLDHKWCSRVGLRYLRLDQIEFDETRDSGIYLGERYRP